LTVADNSGTCQVTDGNAVATLQKPAEQTDVMGHLAGTYTCAENTVVALTLADGSVIEGAPPRVFIGGQECPAGGGGGGGTGAPACSNGVDDDGDGQVDYAPSDSSVPDPGCSSAGDTSEDSEGQFADAHCQASTGFLEGQYSPPGLLYLRLRCQPALARAAAAGHVVHRILARRQQQLLRVRELQPRWAHRRPPRHRTRAGTSGSAPTLAADYVCGSTATLVAVLDGGSAYEITGTFC